jgi:hypothetical protein
MRAKVTGPIQLVHPKDVKPKFAEGAKVRIARSLRMDSVQSISRTERITQKEEVTVQQLSCNNATHSWVLRFNEKRGTYFSELFEEVF